MGAGLSRESLLSCAGFDGVEFVAVAGQRQSLSRQQACQMAKIAEDFRGRDTVVLDLTAVTPIADFFVISTGNNPRQMRAMAEEIRVQMRAQGNLAYGLEGADDSAWVLQDYGDIVLHVFSEAARELYDMEGLWADAQRVDWKAERAAMERAATAPAAS